MQSGCVKHEGRCATIAVCAERMVRVQARPGHLIAVQAKVIDPCKHPAWEEGIQRWRTWCKSSGGIISYAESFSFTLPAKMRRARANGGHDSPKFFLVVQSATYHDPELFVIEKSGAGESLAIAATSRRSPFARHRSHLQPCDAVDAAEAAFLVHCDDFINNMEVVKSSSGKAVSNDPEIASVSSSTTTGSDDGTCVVEVSSEIASIVSSPSVGSNAASSVCPEVANESSLPSVGAFVPNFVRNLSPLESLNTPAERTAH